MGFHVANLGGLQPGGCQRRTDHSLLRQSIGDGEAAGFAVFIDRGAADQRQDVVAGSLVHPKGV